MKQAERPHKSAAAFLRVMRELPRNRRRQALAFLPVLLLAAGIETLFAGSAALFISAISNPTAVSLSAPMVKLRHLAGPDFLTSTPSLVLATAVPLVILVTLKNTFGTSLNYAMSKFAIGIEGHFGRKLLRGYFSLPYEWHLHHNTADLILVVQWANHLGNSLIFPFLKMVGDSLIILCMLTAVFVVEPVASLVVFVLLGGLSVFVFRRIRRMLDRTASYCRDIRQYINREVTKTIHGMKDVRITGRARAFEGTYVDALVPLARLVGLRAFLTQLPFALVETLGVLALCFFVVVSFLYTDASATRITAAVTLLAITAWRVLPAMGRILSEFVKIRSTMPFVITEFEYLDQMPAEREAPSEKPKTEPMRFQNTVHFQEVSFRYQGADRDSISDLNLDLTRGETLGVIGTSGAGKSTLVDLLIGLLRPTNGQVFVDGRPLAPDLALAWVGNLGYVPQSPYICDGSLAENVAFGVPAQDIDREKVRACCDMAAMDFLERLPQGMDTLIGERGAKLSGGQRQRVAIARALYTDPEVMIFDEATSALDQSSERAIRDTIYSLKGTKTLVVIAHRLSSVERCDHILWIADGRLQAEGRPEDILPRYRQAHGVNGQREAGSFNHTEESD